MLPGAITASPPHRTTAWIRWSHKEEAFLDMAMKKPAPLQRLSTLLYRLKSPACLRNLPPQFHWRRYAGRLAGWWWQSIYLTISWIAEGCKNHNLQTEHYFKEKNRFFLRWTHSFLDYEAKNFDSSHRFWRNIMLPKCVYKNPAEIVDLRKIVSLP